MEHKDRHKLARHKRVSIRLDDFSPPPDDSVRLVIKSDGVQIVMKCKEKGFLSYVYYFFIASVAFKWLLLFILLVRGLFSTEALSQELLIIFAVWSVVMLVVLKASQFMQVTVVESLFLQADHFVYSYTGFGWRTGVVDEKFPSTRYLKWRDDMSITRMVEFQKTISRDTLKSLVLTPCVSQKKRLTIDCDDRRLALAPIATDQVRQWLYDILCIYGEVSVLLAPKNKARKPVAFKVIDAEDKISIHFLKRKLHRAEKAQVLLLVIFFSFWVWASYNGNLMDDAPKFGLWCAIGLFLKRKLHKAEKVQVLLLVIFFSFWVWAGYNGNLMDAAPRLGLWGVVGLFLMFYLGFYLVRTSESLSIHKEFVRYRPGIYLLFYRWFGWYRLSLQGKWRHVSIVRGLKDRFLGVSFSRDSLAQVKMLTTDYGNHLFVPLDGGLYEIGRNCTEIEREWLYDYLKSL